VVSAVAPVGSIVSVDVATEPDEQAGTARRAATIARTARQGERRSIEVVKHPGPARSHHRSMPGMGEARSQASLRAV